MSTPLDPSQLPDGPSEYSWGKGMFEPGIADGEGQDKQQDNFGANMYPPQYMGNSRDNYARLVADKRTDPTDPTSNRDFMSLGNPDRYGGSLPLVQAEPQPNVISDEARQRRDDKGPVLKRAK
jgi:hypothetical protein